MFQPCQPNEASISSLVNDDASWFRKFTQQLQIQKVLVNANTQTWLFARPESTRGCLLEATQYVHLVCITAILMKDTEVPNPRHSSACDCTCVNWCLVTSLSCLPCALFCFCPCKIHSRVSDALSQALWKLSLAIWFYCSNMFHS